MMTPTAIHKWFTDHQVDPLIGWEVVEIAHDNEYEIPNSNVLLDYHHTYIMSMLEAVGEEPHYQNLRYFLKHLIPMLRSLEEHFTHNQLMSIRSLADGYDPMIASCVRVILSERYENGTS